MSRIGFAFAVLVGIGAVALSKDLFVIGGVLLWVAAIVLILGSFAKISK